MPLSRHALLAAPQAIDLTVDPRWTMAFAAGIPDDSPTLFDTAGTQVVHPLFPVAAEWQLITAMKASGTGLSADEARRGIHVGHDLVLHRALPASAEVHLEVRTVALGRRRAGATQTIEFKATSADGPLWSTRMTSLYLGVELDGEPSEVESPWPASPSVAAPGGEAVASTTKRPLLVRLTTTRRRNKRVDGNKHQETKHAFYNQTDKMAISASQQTNLQCSIAK